MTRVRLTIEYNLDEPNRTIEDEKEAWRLGDVGYYDLFYLRYETTISPDMSIDITWETITNENKS